MHRWCDHHCQLGAASKTISHPSLPHTWQDTGRTATLAQPHLSPALALCQAAAVWSSNSWMGSGLPLRVTAVTNSHTDFSTPKLFVTSSLPHMHSHLPSGQRVFIRCFSPRSRLFSLKIAFSKNHVQRQRSFGSVGSPRGRDKVVVKLWGGESADQGSHPLALRALTQPMAPECLVSPLGKPV